MLLLVQTAAVPRSLARPFSRGPLLARMAMSTDYLPETDGCMIPEVELEDQDELGVKPNVCHSAP